MMQGTATAGWKRAAPLAVLAACILWVHSSSLSGPSRLTAHHDNIDGAAPLRIEAAAQWKSGQVPRWNPWKRAGMPLLADTTAGAIYPGNFPFLLAAPSGGDSPAFRAMDQVAVLHALLAGLFTFVFLRGIGLAASASVLGALLFACNGTMGWFAAWYIQIQNSVVWLPLILAAVHRAGTAARQARGAVSLLPATSRVNNASPSASRESSLPTPRVAVWIAIGAAAVALQFFAGFPETSFYSALIAIGYAISIAGGPRWWRPLAAVTAIYAAGLLLAAVQLLPALELESLSRRPGELTLETFQSLPASTAMLRGWLLPAGAPGLEFPPMAAYHFGAAGVLAALVGLFAWSRRTVFFGALLVIGFVLSLGDATPLSAWAYQLPGMSAFRHPFKHLFEVSFAMSALAALGAERVLRSRPAGSRWPAALVAIAIAWCTVSLHANQAALVAANPPGIDTSGRAPTILAAIEPGWRVLTPRQVFQKRSSDFLLGDYPSQFHVAALHGAGPFLWSNLAEATGMIEEEMTFRRGLFDARDRTLALLSCRYVVQARGAGGVTPKLDATTWKIAAESGDARLAQRSDALSPVRFVDDVRCSDADTMAASLRGDGVDPATTALVDCSNSSQPATPLARALDLSATITTQEPARLEIATRVPAEVRGFLVISQADLPGWRASVDGKPAVVRRVFGLVQGIEVPGGTERVELEYAPPSLRVGAAISFATIVMLFAACVFVRPRDRA